jgi:hypothetical protein
MTKNIMKSIVVAAPVLAYPARMRTIDLSAMSE